MKVGEKLRLFTGFSADGQEVRWIPPSPARGRPVGFWQETGISCYGYYDQETYWVGDVGGLSALEPKKEDQDGKTLYGGCDRRSWTGEQLKSKDKGDDEYEDEWAIEPPEIHSEMMGGMEVHVKWTSFSSSWQSYLWEVLGIYMMERQDAITGVEEPLEDIEAYVVMPLTVT